MLQRYLVNYFYWWYMVMGASVLRNLQGRINFFLEFTNTLPMAQNLTVPMYQDVSGVGRAISFVIRLMWVWAGGMVTFVLSVPLVVGYLLYLALPIVSIVMILLTIVRILL